MTSSLVGSEMCIRDSSMVIKFAPIKSCMKCALMEMCLVLKEAFGPALTREIAAELSFSTLVLGAS
eukprot:10140650-Prorocentrum_lima.AAC.1